jgi:hypothetical protein
MTPERLRAYPASHYELRYTKQHFTPKDSKKPDVAVLDAIIEDLKLEKERCVYVGDSVNKDITMAIDCGISDVWAEYGQAHQRAEYTLLKEVTHWTPEEVLREARTKARKDIHSTHILSASFSEILAQFEFKDFQSKKPNISDENKKQIIDVWKTIVGVQQHFNDIEMRIRAMFVTIIMALFASLGFLIDKKVSFPAGPFDVQFYVVLPIAGAFGAYLFYFMDRYWYHRLLTGSVKHAIEIEKKYRDEIPELSLSDAIGKESPYILKWKLTKFLARLVVTEPRFRTAGSLHSDGKIELFYKPIIWILLVAALLIAAMGGQAACT